MQISERNFVIERQQTNLATSLFTMLALVAFAGNSVLCRLALGEATIDAASFTAVRLISGALVLWLITAVIGNRRQPAATGGSWIAGVFLFLYAITFSFAYLSLSAGTGALILFAAVQFTMIAAGLGSGEKPLLLEWCGFAAALAGFGYLVLPGIAAPSLSGSALMATAGIAWGFYSLRGRGVADPVRATGDNFLRTVPLVVIVVALRWSSLQLRFEGLLWAMLSGALTSGLGYVVWYAALRRLTATRAATVQLAVPVITALGGVLFLSETLTVRLLVSAGAILGGIGLSVSARALANQFATACKLAPGSGGGSAR
jgi:drug/metabolite transporter (DMT)-like permease